MLFEVLREHDPHHVLLELAFREALSAELDRDGIGACLQRLSTHELNGGGGRCRTRSAGHDQAGCEWLS
jgi:hypothetical protein